MKFAVWPGASEAADAPLQVPGGPVRFWHCGVELPVAGLSGLSVTLTLVSVVLPVLVTAKA